MLWCCEGRKINISDEVFERLRGRHSSSPLAPPKALQFGPSLAQVPCTADVKMWAVPKQDLYLKLCLERPLLHLQGRKHLTLKTLKLDCVNLLSTVTSFGLSSPKET